jgi:hypothetical protein
MELSPSTQAAARSALEEFSNILCNQNVHSCAHKSPPLLPIQSKISPVHSTLSYLSKIHFNIILPPTSMSS